MKILLIGGTGLISTDVTKEAVRRGHDVWLLNRGRHQAHLPDGVKVLRGDADLPETADLLKGMYFDVIADFVAFTQKELSRHLSSFYERCERYVFVSSATVYERNDDLTPIREDTTPASNLGWEYCRGKIGCEKYLEMRHILDESFSCTVIRPYVNYGDTRIPFPLIPSPQWTLVERIREGRPILLPDTHNILTLMHTTDFARAFLSLCELEETAGQTIHITSGYTYRWEDVAKYIGEAVGREPIFAYRSVIEIARAMVPEFGDVYSMLTADKATNWVFDNSKMLSYLPDFRAEVPLSEGIARTLDAFVARGAVGVNQRWNEVCDRLIAKN